MPAQKRKRPYTGATQGAYKKRRIYTPKRQFVPRTMGPFSVSESKYQESGIAATAISEDLISKGFEAEDIYDYLNNITLNEA